MKVLEKPQLYYYWFIGSASILFALYSYNPFQLWFQNDDFLHILLSKKGILFQQNSFRPICDLSVMLDYYLWGNKAWGYHLTNLVLHIICSVLIFIFTKSLFKSYFNIKQSSCVAFFSSVLFFIYAFHSEAVFWILGRSAILGAIFSLLFLLFFLRGKKSTLSTVAYILSYILALLSYESSWVLLFVAAVLLTLKGNTFKLFGWHFAALAVIFLLYLFVRWKVSSEIIGNYEGANLLHFKFATLGINFFKLMARSFTAYTLTNKLLYIAFCIIVCCLFYALFKIKLQHIKYIAAAFIISLLPFLSLGIATNTEEGERFLYFPSLFVCILFALMIINLQGKILKYLFTGLLFLTHSLQLYINARHYRLAGDVVKLTVTELQKCKNYQQVVIEHLPQSQCGALIFRKGFEDALVLFNTELKAGSIKIRSVKNENEVLNYPYKVIYPMQLNNKEMAGFVFTDSVLMVYK